MKDLANHRVGSGLGTKQFLRSRGYALPSLRYERALLPSLFPHIGGRTLFTFPLGRLVPCSTAVSLDIKDVTMTELGQGHGKPTSHL